MNEKDMAFLIIKHEAVQRGLIGEILGRIEKRLEDNSLKNV